MRRGPSLKLKMQLKIVLKEPLNVLRSADEEIGRELLKDYKWVSKAADQCLMDLMNEVDKNLGVGSAVTLALYFRSLKRIYGHLRNITTSVVNPFHRIGFKPKKKKS